jgi:glycosyltransferase involved in cell wall biosynthesis
MKIVIRKRLIILIDGNLTPYRLAHLQKILKIVKNFFNKIIVIYNAKSNLLRNSDKIQALNLRSQELNSNFSFPLKLLHHLRLDFARAKMLLKHSSNSDYVLFLGIYQPLSLFITRLRGGFPIHFCGGFDITRSNNKFMNRVYLTIKWSSQIAMLTLSKKLIFETPSLISSFNLGRFRRKSFSEGHLFVDLAKFFPITPLSNRKYDIGYVGAFSKEKGIVQFVSSLPYVMKRKKVVVQIVGDGYLKDAIKSQIFIYGLNDFICLQSPVKYFNMPKILNNIKLLIVPSYSEGLPNIVIEAMACGTVVLASPVGGIPDIIEQGNTGFLLKSNNPKHIANRVVDLLNHSDILEKVSVNASEYVRHNFSYEKTLEIWRNIFRQLENNY